jgi:DNA helicase-2/ATP-dependent DNA helicase PcrA
MPVRKLTFPTQLEEFTWIAEEVSRLIDAGVKTQDIAIIARRHDTLKDMLPVLQYYKIPLYYQLEQNVLAQPQIRQLLQMVRFTNSLLKEIEPEEDFRLVEILSYPFWELRTETVWQVSLRAASHKLTWLEIMTQAGQFFPNQTEAHQLRQIANFFIELGVKAKHEVAEKVLDTLIGVNSVYQPESTEEETEDGPKEAGAEKADSFVCPFKSYYFDRPLAKNLNLRSSEPHSHNYLTFLSNLRILVQTVRSHIHSNQFYLSDLVNFLDLIEKNQLPVNDNSPYGRDQNRVNLLTAHKAKGLEFEYVFVVSCQEEEWNSKKRGSKLSFPKNLPLMTEPDEMDDKLRLFFVAITRAKSQLYLTSFAQKEDGKESLKLGFVDDEWEEISFSETKKQEILQVYINADGSKFIDWTDQQKSILQGALANYQLSVTHLNNFLDVTNGGPWYFVQTNLLRFPQMKDPSSGYGTAMHAAMREFYSEFKRQGNLPKLEFLQEKFVAQLATERMNRKEFDLWRNRGLEKLAIYYQQKRHEFSLNSRLEINFKTQGVTLGEAGITGQIDKMDFDEQNKSVCVVDFKTGKGLDSWRGATPQENIKLWRYRQQLLFYKLLVENSRDYGQYRVHQGKLEFLEADKLGRVLSLTDDLQPEQANQLARLIQVVYNKIIHLDFPDVSKYSKDLDGIKQFTQDLLEGAV